MRLFRPTQVLARAFILATAAWRRMRRSGEEKEVKEARADRIDLLAHLKVRDGVLDMLLRPGQDGSSLAILLSRLIGGSNIKAVEGLVHEALGTKDLRRGVEGG